MYLVTIAILFRLCIFSFGDSQAVVDDFGLPALGVFCAVSEAANPPACSDAIGDFFDRQLVRFVHRQPIYISRGHHGLGRVDGA